MCQQVNPDYTSTFVFENDFPALLQAGAPEPGKQRCFLSEGSVWHHFYLSAVHTEFTLDPAKVDRVL